jgi:DNA adenine methylase
MTITPFRWAGAKNKLLPAISGYLDPLLNNATEYCEPFIGGGSVTLYVAQKYPNIQLYINDKDEWISSFWSVILDFSKLTDLLQLMQTQPTVELFYKLRVEAPTSDVDKAYRAIFFNRCSFSGIVDRRTGPIGGAEQKSKYTVDCRYNFKKLKEKILQCHELLKNRTIIYNKSFVDFEPLTKTNMSCYCDPPYFYKSDHLYYEKMNVDKHFLLSYVLNRRKNWILSYDDVDMIKNVFYKDCKIVNLSANYCINGVKKNWNQKNELLILP